MTFSLNIFHPQGQTIRKLYFALDSQREGNAQGSLSPNMKFALRSQQGRDRTSRASNCSWSWIRASMPTGQDVGAERRGEIISFSHFSCCKFRRGNCYYILPDRIEHTKSALPSSNQNAIPYLTYFLHIGYLSVCFYFIQLSTPLKYGRRKIKVSLLMSLPVFCSSRSWPSLVESLQCKVTLSLFQWQKGKWLTKDSMSP